MFNAPSAPVLVLSQGTKRESGRKVQQENVAAAKAVGDVVRTCLGPKAMLKMLMDPMGGIVMTNDGNAILREITVQHPAAKTLIEIARTQDEEVGDGTTSVVILGAEILTQTHEFLNDNMHPTTIIGGLRLALDDIVEILNGEVSYPVDLSDNKHLNAVVRSCIGTKFISRWAELACDIAIKAVSTVKLTYESKVEIDIKRYVKVEKLPGGDFEDCKVLSGVMFNKDVTHAKMRRRIENPRILLLDCNLEYKKGESQTNIEMLKTEDFSQILELEENYIRKICDDIIKYSPDLVITEKGVSDLAQHFLLKANITCIRRLRKTDNLRVARACGATIVNRTEDITEADIGTGAGLYEVRKIGDEYFSFIEECKDPKACTVLLRGASKDVLNEFERNLQDALNISRNIFLNPRMVPGGGAIEMSISNRLQAKAKTLSGVVQGPYTAVAKALEIIPRTIAQNCGGDTVRVLTALRAKHATGGNDNWGINGDTGKLEDMQKLGIIEPMVVKMQTYKTAIETAMLLLRIDDIVAGSKKRDADNAGGAPAADN